MYDKDVLTLRYAVMVYDLEFDSWSTWGLYETNEEAKKRMYHFRSSGHRAELFEVKHVPDGYMDDEWRKQ